MNSYPCVLQRLPEVIDSGVVDEELNLVSTAGQRAGQRNHLVLGARRAQMIYDEQDVHAAEAHDWNIRMRHRISGTSEIPL